MAVFTSRTGAAARRSAVTNRWQTRTARVIRDNAPLMAIAYLDGCRRNHLNSLGAKSARRGHKTEGH